MTTVFLTHTPAMLADYYGAKALASLRELASVRLNETGRVLDGPGLVREAAGASIIVSDRQTEGPASVFDGLPDLCAFLRVAVDVRNIDIAAASRNGVLVTQATPGFMASVAELGLGFIIDLARGITRSTGQYRAGTEAEVRMGRQLRGSTLGILGYGAIGQELGRMALALGMEVLVADPFRRVAPAPGLSQGPMDEVLARADFVCCLVVATAETENLMDAAAFARMRPGSVFVNLSRGNLVDEAALAAALDSGHLAGAALDVGRAPDQKPSLALASRADVIATPHVAGLTPPAAEHQAFDTVAQVKAILAGRMPEGALNLEAAGRLGRLAVPSGAGP